MSMSSEPAITSFTRLWSRIGASRRLSGFLGSKTITTSDNLQGVGQNLNGQRSFCEHIFAKVDRVRPFRFNDEPLGVKLRDVDVSPRFATCEPVPKLRGSAAGGECVAEHYGTRASQANIGRFKFSH